jgi:hypothetical protein
VYRGAVRLSIGFIALIGLALPLRGQAAGLSAWFDRLDRESRDLVQHYRCVGTTARLRESGVLGIADSLGDQAVCITVGGRFYGVILSTDSADTRATHFNVVDLGSRQLFHGPVDTLGVLAILRALDAAAERGYAEYQKAKLPFLGVAFRFDGDSISAWMFPNQNRPMLGGMRGYQYGPDGRSLIRETNDFASLRPFVIPDTGTVVINSSADSLPTMSEMVMANSLNEAGRIVRIETRSRSSTLAGSGARAVWVHIRKPPPQ